MKRKLPPLAALRAFEAAGRHLSFTRAAEELSVTQAAISHQVKALEAHLQCELFVQGARRTQLSPAGRRLLHILTSSFDDIAKVLASIRYPDGDTVRILVSPFLSANWLTLKIAAFEGAHPTYRVHLQHATKMLEADWGDADVAILWGRGEWKNAECEHLFGLELTPMCSPSFLATLGSIKEPQDLDRATLIHTDGYEPWASWTRATNSNLAVDKGPVFDDTTVLIKAVVAGLGVGLLPVALGVSEYLQSGQLIRLFDASIESTAAYYVIFPRQRQRSPSLTKFVQWLKDLATDEGFRRGA